MIFYSNNRKTRSNDEYENDAIFKQQLNEIVKIFKMILNNDVNTQSKRYATKCWMMCHDNEYVKCQNWKTKHCKAIARKQQCKIDHYQWHEENWERFI